MRSYINRNITIAVRSLVVECSGCGHKAETPIETCQVFVRQPNGDYAPEDRLPAGMNVVHLTDARGQAIEQAMCLACTAAGLLGGRQGASQAIRDLTERLAAAERKLAEQADARAVIEREADAVEAAEAPKSKRGRQPKIADAAETAEARQERQDVPASEPRPDGQSGQPPHPVS